MMAKTGKITTERISEFYGLITDADLTNIPKTMSPDCRNVRPMLCGLKSRSGHEKVNVSSYNEPIRELFVIPLTSGFFGNQAVAGGGGTDPGGGGSGGG